MSAAGKRDRRLTIEKGTRAVSDSGTPVLTWTPLWSDAPTVWASRRELSGRESFVSEQLVAKADVAFEIVYPAGRELPSPHEQYRLTCEGVTYDITDVAEVGRRDGLRLIGFARAE